MVAMCSPEKHGYEDVKFHKFYALHKICEKSHPGRHVFPGGNTAKSPQPQRHPKKAYCGELGTSF